MSFLAVSQELLAWVQRHTIRELGGRTPSDQEAYEALAELLEPVRVELEHLRLATEENGFRSVFEALDDLWGCIGKTEMQHLQPDTVRLAKANHQALWHNENEDPDGR